MHGHGYTQNTLSASRFCRRLARVPQSAWNTVFALLSEVFKAHNTEEVFAVDSYPVLVCANCRINRCALFPVEEHETLRGYQSSKKRWFYGFKVHLLVTKKGWPVEFFLSEGSLHDLESLKRLKLDVPERSMATKPTKTQAKNISSKRPLAWSPQGFLLKLQAAVIALAFDRLMA